MERRSPDTHVLCGTCVGEYERCCGYFESKVRRDLVGVLTRVQFKADMPEEVCCNCGQVSWPEATFKQPPDPYRGVCCDGVHEPPDEDA